MNYLGIDGGGTKTTALVCDENFNKLAQCVGGSINTRSEGLENARENMRRILRDIEKNTGVRHFDAVFIGSSALFGRAGEDELAAFTDGVFDAERIAMDSDLFIALKACKKENALAAICGTGSMAAAFGENGEVVTRGGFGYMFGDEGSAYAIAREAMFRAARAAEGTEKNTALTDALCAFYNVKDVYGFTDRMYEPPMERKALAAFAPCVTACAENGDGTALEILRHQAELFAATVRTLAEKLPRKPEIFLFGGVFEHDKIFTSVFKEYTADRCVSCSLLTEPPVTGAVRAAAELCQ